MFPRIADPNNNPMREPALGLDRCCTIGLIALDPVDWTIIALKAGVYKFNMVRAKKFQNIRNMKKSNKSLFCSTHQKRDRKYKKQHNLSFSPCLRAVSIQQRLPSMESQTRLETWGSTPITSLKQKTVRTIRQTDKSDRQIDSQTDKTDRRQTIDSQTDTRQPDMFKLCSFHFYN